MCTILFEHTASPRTKELFMLPITIYRIQNRYTRCDAMHTHKTAATQTRTLLAMHTHFPTSLRHGHSDASKFAHDRQTANGYHHTAIDQPTPHHHRTFCRRRALIYQSMHNNTPGFRRPLDEMVAFLVLTCKNPEWNSPTTYRNRLTTTTLNGWFVHIMCARAKVLGLLHEIPATVRERGVVRTNVNGRRWMHVLTQFTQNKRST